MTCPPPTCLSHLRTPEIKQKVFGRRYPRGLALAAQQLSAIDDDRMPRDPTGERRGQEQHRVRDLLRPAQASERDALQNAVVESRIAGLALLPGAAGKLDRARSHRVHADFLAREICGLAHRV